MDVAVESGTYTWEKTFDKSWEEIEEVNGELKSIGIKVQRKRKSRLDKAHVNAAVHRGMLRFTVIVLDLTKAVTATDLSPSRFSVMIKLVKVKDILHN